MKYENLKNYLLEKLQLDTAKSDVLEYMIFEYAGVLKECVNSSICCKTKETYYHFGFPITSDLLTPNHEKFLTLIAKGIESNIEEAKQDFYAPNYYPEISQEAIGAGFGYINGVPFHKKPTEICFSIPYDVSMTIINASSLIKASGNIENLSQEELKNLKKGVLAYKVNNKDESLLNLINKLEDKIKRLSHSLNISNVALLVNQERRTNPDLGFFANLPNDSLGSLASQLSPEMNEIEAAKLMMNQIDRAKKIFEKIRPFSINKDKIDFSEHEGTNVDIEKPTEYFINWFNTIEPKVVNFVFSGYRIYKIDNDTLAINKGSGTPGIQIKRHGERFKAINNLTADNINDATLDIKEINSLRKKNLQQTLTDIYLGMSTSSVSKLNLDEAINEAREEHENTGGKCSIQ
ncbi:TPA: hypothetical protein ACPSKB_000697 [Legionella feeleii]